MGSGATTIVGSFAEIEKQANVQKKAIRTVSSFSIRATFHSRDMRHSWGTIGSGRNTCFQGIDPWFFQCVPDLSNIPDPQRLLRSRKRQDQRAGKTASIRNCYQPRGCSAFHCGNHPWLYHQFPAQFSDLTGRYLGMDSGISVQLALQKDGIARELDDQFLRRDDLHFRRDRCRQTD